MDDTVSRLLAGDQRALSRLISALELGDPRGAEVLAQLWPYTGKAYCIGITGPPGVGKSTIVDRMAELMRSQGLSVGIIAVDPTSPYTGGSFMGDRIRMQRHYLDPGVFIRSMATRDNPGGLPRVVRGAVRLLDASGKDMVIVETVGVGQTELGVMGVADTVIVTLMPGMGDIIQTLKAGLMEIADVFVVNKADKEGADQMVVAITSMLKMASNTGEWTPPVVSTQAHNNNGVSRLYEQVEGHRHFLEQTSRLESRRGERRVQEFMGTIEAELSRRVRALIDADQTLSAALEDVKKGELEPYSAALKLVDEDLPLAGPRASARLKAG
jgi:LAO/AO transport system kinase